MSRKKTEINPIRAERVKTLIEREGITQKDLADRIFQTQQNVSRILNRKTALTEETAQDIIKAFPESEYRIEWLLGYDDSMTYADLVENDLEMRNKVAYSMWGIIEKSLNKEGKSLKFVHRSGQHVDSIERFHADCYYSIVDREGNELKRLTALEMATFEEKLQEYCDFMTGKYL